jgi:hypothetical protein
VPLIRRKLIVAADMADTMVDLTCSPDPNSLGHDSLGRITIFTTTDP